MLYTRRELGKLALAGVPAAGILLKSDAGIAAGKPNSKWAGVQVGLNVPYSFGDNMMTGDETLIAVSNSGSARSNCGRSRSNSSSACR